MIYNKHAAEIGEEGTDNSFGKLKAAMMFSNEYELASVLKSLGIAYKNAPEYGEALSFELFRHGGEYFVEVNQNDSPVNIGGNVDGIMKFADFINYAYPRMFFGDIDEVCSGKINPSDHLIPKHDTYWDMIGKSKTKKKPTIEKAISIPAIQRITIPQRVEETKTH